MHKRIYNLIIFILLAASFFGAAHFALAAPDFWGGQYDSVGDQLGLGTGDPRVMAANVIRIALGFLGIIAVGLILYAGWLWMTAKGEADRIEKAKKVLISAVIGLLIILSSFAIVTFILNKLMDATGAGGGGGGGACDPACGLGQCCVLGSCQLCPAGGLGAFYIKNQAPPDTAVNLPRNVKIKFTFSANVDGTTADAARFKISNGSGPVAGAIAVEGGRIIFTPDQACEANPCNAAKCFTAGDTITAEAVNGAGGILSVGGQTLNCGGLFKDCSVTFKTGNYIDCQKPKVDFTDNQICVDTNNIINAWASDDSGIDNIEFFVDSGLIGQNINLGNNNPFTTAFAWDSTGKTPGTAIALEAATMDLAENTAEKSKTITLRPKHCCNGLKDSDETGTDCGGSCAACAGAACGVNLNDACAAEGDCSLNNSKCFSGFCDCGGDAASCTAAGYKAGVASCCLCQTKPVIYWVAPEGGFCRDAAGAPTNTPCQNNSECGGGTCDTYTPNGAEGNLATIGGRNFGNNPGKVIFKKAGGEVEAALANSVNPNCAGAWQDDQIIVVVPAGAATGPIKIIDTNNNEETTNDSFGPAVKDFAVNTIVRPGLCKLTPDNGKAKDELVYNGIGLLGGLARFGRPSDFFDALSSDFTAGDLQGKGTVPYLQTGKTTTFVSKANIASNYINFTKDKEAEAGLRIESFEPQAGKTGQYVTIYGSGFGNSRGASKVYFGAEEADYQFPEVCADSAWSENQIIVKVPSGAADGDYAIKVEVGPVFADTSALTPAKFNINSTLPLAPSLCKIKPIMGPNNSQITLWGEYFEAFNNPKSKVRFNLNHDQFGPLAPTGPLISWGVDGKADKIEALVHGQAITGPVRAVNDVLAGNGINFTVGNCAKDDDCGSGNVCCPAGTSKSGRCEIAGADKYENCYLNIKSSVYEWEFSTAAKLPCDANLLTPQCEADDSFCLKHGFDYCDVAGGCVCANGAPAESCMGINNGQCADNLCPNSPGKCSFYLGGNDFVTGICDSTCNSLPGCAGGLCSYNINADQCYLSGKVCDLYKNAVDSLGKTVKASCVLYSGNPRWQIKTNASCPAGWTSAGGNICIENAANCDLCSNNFKCQDDFNGDSKGLCAVNKDICPGGSKCILNECKKTDQAACECCCRIANSDQDCCSPLKCEGNCGSDASGVDTNTYGHCSGCASVGATSAEHDAACNCSGNSGKFCDTSGSHPEGICSDCARLSTAGECANHSTTCCIDAKNGFKCGSGDGSLVLGGYCAYFSCNSAAPYDCLGPDITGGYKGDATCKNQCKAPGVSAEKTCFNGNESLCNLTCSVGYGCYGDSGCLDTNPTSTPPACVAGDASCLCCCSPGTNDQCGLINPKLSCTADKGSCTGSSRGLCCGCSQDSDCGDPDIMGCGTDSCCHPRPNILLSNYPADESVDVCRNTLITATFNEEMKLSSFSGNVIVVGDYDSAQCPEGTQFLAVNDYSNKHGLAKIYDKIISFIKKELRKISRINKDAKAYSEIKADHNYCAIAGTVGGYTDAAGNSVLTFKVKKPLDANRKYYVILKGDNNINDTEANGILTVNGIGIKGPVGQAAFNGIQYYNVHIWSFDTGDKICELSYITVDPPSYLFQKAGATKEFQAYPKSADKQNITAIPGMYNWAWSWSSENKSVADVTNSDNFKQTVTAQNVKDGKTIITAAAVITDDNVLNPSTKGKTKTGKANVYVLLCENPWPPVPISGIWTPWVDNKDDNMNCTIFGDGCPNTNFELYYCRDAGGPGTADDLPAVLSGTDQSVIRGTSLEKNILKEIYYFREGKPGANSSFAAQDLKTGGIVKIEWPINPDPNVIGYKLYYGTASGKYDKTITLSLADNPGLCLAGNCNHEISALKNKTKYYFVLTSYYKTGSESEYSAETSVTPTDQTAPALPGNFLIESASEKGEFDFIWTASASADIAGYKIYYGTAPGVYGASEKLGKVTKATITGLTYGSKYYVALSAYDSSNNESAKSTEIIIDEKTYRDLIRLADMKLYKDALEAFKKANGHYPGPTAEGVPDTGQMLGDDEGKIETALKPYLSTLPNDPLFDGVKYYYAYDPVHCANDVKNVCVCSSSVKAFLSFMTAETSFVPLVKDTCSGDEMGIGLPENSYNIVFSSKGP